MTRHGAQLVFAYARAEVPRICVILRKSYGVLEFIVSNSGWMNLDTRQRFQKKLIETSIR